MSRRQEWLGDLFFLVPSFFYVGFSRVWDGWNRSLLLLLLLLLSLKCQMVAGCQLSPLPRPGTVSVMLVV